MKNLPTVPRKHSSDSSSHLQVFCMLHFFSKVTGWGGRTLRCGSACCPPAGPRYCTFRAVNACVLVVAQEKALLAAALVAPHGIDTGVLAAAIVLQALVHIWRGRGISFASTAVSNAPPSLASRSEGPLLALHHRRSQNPSPWGPWMINSVFRVWGSCCEAPVASMRSSAQSTCTKHLCFPRPGARWGDDIPALQKQALQDREGDRYTNDSETR